MRKVNKRKRFQPAIKGGRRKMATGVLPIVREGCERLAVKYGVSLSWVLSVFAADQLGIDVPSYLDVDTVTKGKRV